MLEKELRVLYRGLQAAGRECHTGCGLRLLGPQRLVAHIATPTLTRSHFLIVLLPMAKVSHWGPFLSKPPHARRCFSERKYLGCLQFCLFIFTSVLGCQPSTEAKVGWNTYVGIFFFVVWSLDQQERFSPRTSSSPIVQVIQEGLAEIGHWAIEEMDTCLHVTRDMSPRVFALRKHVSIPWWLLAPSCIAKYLGDTLQHS